MATPSDPIEDLKRAVEIIRASTGERDPRYIVMSESVYERIRAMVDEQRAGAGTGPASTARARDKVVSRGGAQHHGDPAPQLEADRADKPGA